MRFFQLDSPLMNFLNKVADLMWLNILTMVCCIPLVTVGASLTALHYMALKIVRNEECYITRGYFKSFKENFKQATVIWLILLLVTGILAGDFYIIYKAEIEFNTVIKVIILAAAILVLFTATFVFPVLAKFDNTVKRTIKNAFVMSILQFPKTILMIVMSVVPIVVAVLSYKAWPIVFLFCYSVPALVSAMLYNKFFQKLEDQILAETSGEGQEDNGDEHIFQDEVVENVGQIENKG